jgi:hypothetical protein
MSGGDMYSTTVTVHDSLKKILSQIKEPASPFRIVIGTLFFLIRVKGVRQSTTTHTKKK